MGRILAIKINLEDGKEKIFRERAMKKFGYKKGALSKALEEAVDMWLLVETNKLPMVNSPTRELDGLLSGIEETSVELQHLGSRLFLKE